VTHPSSLVIDALAAGKLAGDDAAGARTHIDGCARCRADLAAAQAACVQFTEHVLPRTIGAIARPRRRWWAFAPAVLVPALAVIALVMWQRRGDTPTVVDAGGGAIRMKGGMVFQMFANRGGEVIAVHDGARLAPGDAIRFVVGSGGPAFLLVASIDGAGSATVYYPYGGDRSGAATPEPSELPGSIVLDAAPGPERVFALVSTEPLDAAMVKQALLAIGARGPTAIREAHSLAVPATDQATIVFEKGPP
jgi:hypothetical protein